MVAGAGGKVCGIDSKDAQVGFWGDGIRLYLDCVGGWMTVFVKTHRTAH